MRDRCYIFDIDGTLADCTHRLPFIHRHPKDWSAFYSACVYDKPIRHMIDVARALADHAPLVFATGRNEIVREETKAWLFRHGGLVASNLYMRRDGDHRDDAIIKIEFLQQIRDDGYEPIMAFEDRTRMVAAWRVAGIPCAQVAEGNF